MAAQYVVICVIGMVSLAHAQTPCTGPSTYTDAAVLTQSLASITASCTEYGGDITVSGVTWNAPGPTPVTIDLSGVRTFEGSIEFVDLAVVNESVTDPGTLGPRPPGKLQISMPDLVYINQNLVFSNIPGLDLQPSDGFSSVWNLTFNNVTFYDNSNTNLEQIFPSLSQVNDFRIAGSSIESIGPFKNVFGTKQVRDVSFVAVDNQDLRNVELHGYGNNTMNIVIQGNNKLLEVSFPDITQATINLEQVASFEAGNLLTVVENSNIELSGLQRIHDNTFETLSLQRLTSINAQTLEIDQNMNLKQLDLPALAKVSRLQIIDNTNLKTVNLPALASATSIQIAGPIESISAQQLTDVTDEVNIAPFDDSACSAIDIPSAVSTTCSTSLSTVSQGAGTSTPNPGDMDQGNSGGSGSGGLSIGAKAGIGVGAGIGALLIIGALVFCCARRRKQRQRINPRSAGVDEYYMEPKNHERSPARYTKVANSGSVDHGSVDQSSEDRVSPSSHFAESRFGENWSPPEQRVPNTDGRLELEEQQGMRHEMDARSLNDMDLDDDREETRSLEDIERAHGQR